MQTTLSRTSAWMKRRRNGESFSCVVDLEDFQARFGYWFRRLDLLRTALTHPSVSHDQGQAVSHNQRLEFLGDAVLQLVLSEELFAKFADVGEGPLTKARAQMVNRTTLAEQARRLGLGDFLRMSRGEESHGGRQRPSALADAYEAILGAVFLDGGFGAAQEVVLREFREPFGKLEVIPNLENPKGELQEWLQTDSNEPPQYRVQSVNGPDHDRLFETAVFHQGRELGRGVGKSKKAAESQAALAALLHLRQKASESIQSSDG